MRKLLPILLLSLLIFGAIWYYAASNIETEQPLPIWGEPTITAAGDTTYPQVPKFQFVDQDSQLVTNATFEGKIYVTDFFFIHCPTICPKVTANCLRIYEKYKHDPRIAIVSHSVDPRNDTVAALRRHALKLGVTDNKMWHFVTGNKDDIYNIAEQYYAKRPKEDPDAPGGFDHDGALILVDKNRHMRASCDGTVSEEVDAFMNKIDRLLQEQFPLDKG
jgi:protein SCO1